MRLAGAGKNTGLHTSCTHSTPLAPVLQQPLAPRPVNTTNTAQRSTSCHPATHRAKLQRTPHAPGQTTLASFLQRHNYLLLKCGILDINQVPKTSVGIRALVPGYIVWIILGLLRGQIWNSLQLAADRNLMSLPAGLLECLEPQWSNVGAIVYFCLAMMQHLGPTERNDSPYITPLWFRSGVM